MDPTAAVAGKPVRRTLTLRLRNNATPTNVDSVLHGESPRPRRYHSQDLRPEDYSAGDGSDSSHSVSDTSVLVCHVTVSAITEASRAVVFALPQ